MYTLPIILGTIGIILFIVFMHFTIKIGDSKTSLLTSILMGLDSIVFLIALVSAGILGGKTAQVNHINYAKIIPNEEKTKKSVS